MGLQNNFKIKRPENPAHCPRCSKKTADKIPFCKYCDFDLRFGTPRRVKSGFCLYCKRLTKLSAEHIFPKWLQKIYPLRFARTVHELRRPELQQLWEQVPVHKTTEVFERSPYDTVILNVCKLCNNGWMSKLQAEAKPLVKALADGGWPDFTKEECIILSRWALMVSINLECYGRIKKTAEWQLRSLMNGEMPLGWKIYIGRMFDDTEAGRSFCRCVGMPFFLHDDEPIPLLSTYFCIEKAAFYTMGTYGERIMEMGLQYSPFPGDDLGRVLRPLRQISPEIGLKESAEQIRLTKEDLDAIQAHFCN